MADFNDKQRALQEQLAAPFGLEEIEWRIQRSGMTKPRGDKPAELWAIVTPFIKARSIAERLDTLVGPARWRVEYQPLPNGGMLAGLALYLELPGSEPHYEWVMKWDGTGRMEGGGDRGLSVADAGKGEISTAFKRAAAAWGIGRYLGKVPECFATICADGRFRGQAKLDGGQRQGFRWNPPALPVWALPKAPTDQSTDAAREQRASRAVANQARRGAQEAR